MTSSGRKRSVRTHLPVVVLSLAMFALVLAGLGCGGSSTTTTAAAPPETTSPTGGGSGSTGAATVTIASFAFSPASTTVKVGETITWTNNDSASHTVVADDNSFASGDLANGASFSFTFTQAGTYPYHCSIHPSMTATVVVQ